MTIDWKKEVEARKDDLLNDLIDLLKVKSEREDDKATADAPFGPGPRDALLHMLAYGERDGFTVKNVDNYAGHIEFGEGDETLGIFGHMDVVPAGDGWSTDPYDPVINDNKIYARGSSDDKGPSMAAYYGMKIIKELGLPLSKKSVLSLVLMKKAAGQIWITTLSMKKSLILASHQMPISQLSMEKKEM